MFSLLLTVLYIKVFPEGTPLYGASGRSNEGFPRRYSFIRRPCAAAGTLPCTLMPALARSSGKAALRDGARGLEPVRRLNEFRAVVHPCWLLFAWGDPPPNNGPPYPGFVFPRSCTRV